ncbi:MAG: NAD(P)/FAD-dependent oxidoreductase [Chloroflexi bacterium]|nr:NAD(P)/FAD-dependent oxidoreductase [Chloroflexota bacterium]
MARIEGKTTVVLGAGVGGLVTANELARRLGRQHRVILIDKGAEYLYTPSLLWVMVGLRQPRQITKELRRMVRPGVDLVQSEVVEVDPEHRQVKTEAGAMGYDYLVVALGADTAPGNMPGLEEPAHNFYDLEGAANLGRALAHFDRGTAVVAVSSLPYKCPAAPYEAALLLDDDLRRKGVRGKVDIQVYAPEPQPMPVAGAAVGNAVKGMLTQQGISYHPGVQVVSMDAQRKELVFKDGSTATFDLLAAVPPHRPPRVVKESALANEAGWIPVDRRTLRTRFENVYAIGDVAAVSLPNGKLLPKAGVFAHAQGLAVAGTIVGQIVGAPGREFDGVGFCWVSMARGRAGFASGAFYAEPEPAMKLQKPGWLWNAGKLLFERYWMGEGLNRKAAELGLLLGSRLLGIPAAL